MSSAPALLAGALVLVGLGWTTAARASACTWNAASAGSWSNTGNWTNCASATPGSSDSVTFNSSKNGQCNVDSDVTVTALTVNGFTGEIVSNPASTLTVTGNYSQNSGRVGNQASGGSFPLDGLVVSGTFALSGGTLWAPPTVTITGAYTQSGSSTFTGNSTLVTMKSDFNLQAGTFTAPGVLVVGGKFNKTGGTFTQGTRAVILTSSSNQTHVMASQTFYDLILNDGLIGYWKLDEASFGSAADSSGYGWTMSPSGTPTVNATGFSSIFKNSGAANLAKATSQHFTYGSMPTTMRPTSWTISAWVKATSLDSSGSEVWSGGNSWALRLATGVKVRAIMRYASGSWDTCDSSNSFTANDGNWHHVVGVNNAGNVHVWLDGVETTSGTNCGATGDTQSYTSADDDMAIGAHTSSANFDLDGSIDDLRLYNRALSDGEILTLYSGNHPGASLATHKPDSAITVSNKFVIGSGKWDDNGQSWTVSGSYYNFGGLMTSSGTLTMNATATGKEITTGNQRFNNLTFNGSGGGWTMRDRLNVAGTLTISNGTLDTGGYRMHLGTVNKTGGTFTSNGNLITVDSASNQTFTLTDSINTIRFEDPTETSLVGYWKLDDQAGPTARDVSANGNDGTVNTGPRWVNSTYANGAGTAAVTHSSSYDNAGWMVFGGDSNVSFSVGNYNPISISAWFYITGDGTSNPRIVNLPYFRLYVTLGDLVGAYADWGTTDGNWQSTTTFTRNAWHHVVVTYDSTSGGAPTIYLDNATLTLTQLSGPGSGTYGSTGTGYIGNSPGLGDDFNGSIDDVRIYNVILSAADVDQLYNGNYPGKGGTATYTLGGNLSPTNVRVDSGTLDTSSYTLTTTGDCYINAGALTIGSSIATCATGLTVREPAVLNMNTAGGTLKLGSGQTLTMDGTLNATTSGANPTIQNNGSGTYTFSVGSSSTATPTLNINGLKVRNTGANGMYINAVAGSNTTITRFDNVDFGSGNTASGSTLLKIYGTSLYMTGDGCTFDRNGMHATSYNVAITGNGTADGETRAIFGNATCKNTSGNSETCENADSDDDSGGDGVGDTSASNAAVAQFVYHTYSDTAGAMAGFPTAAFNWTNFTYWKTYVAFNNIDSNSTHRLYVRNEDGSDAGYHWDIPSGKGTFVGTPKWDMEGNNHYVYVVTSLGYVYKIQDTGGALNTDTNHAWPYWNGGSSTGTSPLAVDASNLYWSGNDSGGNPKMFSLDRSAMTLNASTALVANATGAPAVADVSGTRYLFTALNTRVYKMTTNVGVNTVTAIANNVTSYMAVYYGRIYFGDSAGVFRAWDTSLSSVWSYTNGNASAISAFYFEPKRGRAFYGDAAGKLYAIVRSGSTANGVVLSSNYPYTPSGVAATDNFNVAPVWVDGVVAFGTSGGKVVFLNAQNGSSQPALIQLYHLGSAVSSIAYDYQSATLGNFMVGTANGHIYFFRHNTGDNTTMIDPDATP